MKMDQDKSVSKKKVVVGVTGSIAAYKAGDIVRRLMDHQLDVSVVMTSGAERFVTPLTFSSLTGREVNRDYFQGNQDWKMPHISLAKADLILIAPATANVIGKIASGLADDLLTCTVLATQSPILVAPAMNTNMFLNPFVQENCRKLKESGIHFIEPVEGKLACGDEGTGHLADVNQIVSSVLSFLK